MLKQGLTKTLVKMLSDDNTEERQRAFNMLISLAEHGELVLL
jgi:hypothetical protein